jgi:hypothetical protein
MDVTKDSINVDVTKHIANKTIEYITAIPQLLFACIASFLSGYVWIWVIYTYFSDSDKGLLHLNSVWAKTALGFLWFALFLVPAFLLKFGMNQPWDDKIFKIITLTVMLGAFTQALVIIFAIKYKIKNNGK